MMKLKNTNNFLSKLCRDFKAKFKSLNINLANLKLFEVKIIHAITFQYHQISLFMEKHTIMNSVVRIMFHFQIICSFRIKKSLLISINRIN